MTKQAAAAVLSQTTYDAPASGPLPQSLGTALHG
jgi:hypothetical protein